MYNGLLTPKKLIESKAKPGDIIVIPGLGHDLYLERNGVKYPYDERKVIAKLIDEMIEDYKSEQREILDPILKYYFNLNTNDLSYFVPTVFKIVAGILAVLLINSASCKVIVDSSIKLKSFTSSFINN